MGLGGGCSLLFVFVFVEGWGGCGVFCRGCCLFLFFLLFVLFDVVFGLLFCLLLVVFLVFVCVLLLLFIYIYILLFFVFVFQAASATECRRMASLKTTT